MIEIPKKEPLNIVPFIDIMLVLLAMVLLVSTFIAKGEIKIDLPKSKSAATAVQDDRARTIQVNGEGTLYIDGEETPIEKLGDWLADLPRDTRIVLRMDKSARFEHFISVVDLFKKFKHDNFNIATEKENAE